MDTKEQQRTNQQNRALHKYFDLVAKTLNDAGYSVQTVIKQQMDISWSMILVKNLLWRRAQEVHLGKISTTELSTRDIDIIFDQVNLFLSEKFGITQPFPSIENLMSYDYQPED